MASHKPVHPQGPNSLGYTAVTVIVRHIEDPRVVPSLAHVPAELVEGACVRLPAPVAGVLLLLQRPYARSSRARIGGRGFRRWSMGILSRLLSCFHAWPVVILHATLAAGKLRSISVLQLFLDSGHPSVLAWLKQQARPPRAQSTTPHDPADSCPGSRITALM
eukprot:COSAG05_NODE_5217_length_1233_cov_2.580247_3_plen_163_part_00